MREELERSIWPLSQLGSNAGWPREAWRGEGGAWAPAYPTDHTPPWKCLRQWRFQRLFCFSWHLPIPSASSNVFFLPFKVHDLGLTVSMYSQSRCWSQSSSEQPPHSWGSWPQPCLALRVLAILRMTVESDSEAVNRYMRQCKLWNHTSKSLECNRLSQNMHLYH